MPDLSLNPPERSASRVRDQQGRQFLDYFIPPVGADLTESATHGGGSPRLI